MSGAADPSRTPEVPQEQPSQQPPARLPRWLNVRCTSRGGARLHIRPLRADDAARERAFIDGLSPTSLSQRLLGTIREVTDEQVAELVRPDWPRRLALAALSGDAITGDGIVGVARFDVSERPGSAEFAIVVADHWQRRGVGHALFDRLVRAARLAGYRELVGTTFAVNREMIELARSHGFEVGPEEGEPSLRRLTLPLLAA